jgi:NTP pyrophosphatase (non-canonical NTP hydrolase)
MDEDYTTIDDSPLSNQEMEDFLSACLEFETIYSHYGLSHQLVKTVEECGELVQAIAQYQLDPSVDNAFRILEEVADVYIMTGQLAFSKVDLGNGDYLDCHPVVRRFVTGKINRQLERMREEPTGVC